MKQLTFTLLAYIYLVVGISSASAELIDNGDGTISDTVQQIMWTQDANLPSTLGLTSGDYTNAQDFIQHLNDTNYAGYSNWRLPQGTDPRNDPTGVTYDGQYYHDKRGSEFGHLFYNELGGCSGWHISVKCVGFSTEPNDDPDLAKFINIPPVTYPSPAKIYWTEMVSEANPDNVWTFSLQNGSYKEQGANETLTLRAWAVRDAVIVPPQKQGIVLLHDLSGSMYWSHTGDPNTPDDQKRIYHAKRAANFFLTLLNLHATSNTNFGVAAFPQQPWVTDGCVGSDVTGGIQLFDDAFYNTLTTTTIPNLSTSGATPMLAGLDTAAGMLSAPDLANKVILLLSDGYHNCPSGITSGGPEVTAKISEMNSQGIRVSAIGFARPEDIDENLLSEISTGTLGHYYGVTGPTFNHTNWDPQLALTDTYKDILIQDLGMSGIVDPVKVIEKGKPLTINAPLSDADKIVTFYASWTGDEENRVNMSLLSSDGVAVPETDLNIKKSSNYTMMSIPSSFLSEPDKVGEKPWDMTLTINPDSNINSAPVLYGVIATSELKLKSEFDKRSYFTGDAIRLTATLSQSGTRVENVTEVTGYLSSPAIGRGEWYAMNSGTFHESINAPTVAPVDVSPSLHRLANYINKVKKVSFPQRPASNQVSFVDDGTNGDIKAHDGVYTALITNTAVEGSYIASVVASGKTKKGIPFRRETKLSTFVDVAVSPEHTIVAVAKLDISSRLGNLYNVKFRPLDKFGKNLGPGHAQRLSFTTNSGKVIGAINDHLNGEYSAVVRLGPKVDPKQVTTSIGIGKVAIVRDMTGKVPSQSDSLLKKTYMFASIILALIAFILFRKLRRTSQH